MRATLLLFSIIFSVLAGCASQPSAQPAPTSAGQDETPLNLYARLVKQNGQYTVTGICWVPAQIPNPGGSQYPRCREPLNKDGALYFDFSTLAPTGTSTALCPVWGESRPKPPPQCDAYKDIHEADVTTNVVASPLIAIGAVLSLGREVPSMVKLDEDAFKREIEKALPTPRRLAMIQDERAWRQAAPAREQAASRQFVAQLDAERQEREARTQVFRAQVLQANRDAEQQFQISAAAPKFVGATVCSADNRLAFVDQVSGARVRLKLYGVAVARWSDALGNANPLGPFDVDRRSVGNTLPSDLDAQSIKLPVTDRLYLFKPHRTVAIQPYTGGGTILWDDAQLWGSCSWRV